MTHYSRFLLIIPFISFYSNASEEVDMSDPMAVYTGGDIKAGDQGLGGSLQFSVGQNNWAAMGKIESTNNFETYRARIFTPNKVTGTGVYIDASKDDSVDNISSNYATIGVLQVIPVNEKLQFNVGLTYGKAWESNEKFEDTDIINAQIYAKYNINEKFFVLASPQYQYGLNGEEFRDFYAELNVGYKIDSSNVLLLTGSTENQTWITYKFKI
ncbi:MULTISPECIES: hypothetical protein [unclassified Aliivibrio]|uniref:hypothetical protein n=1 Tax=unclassified Aliivibrio TaxID=2645654 RepID=UPI00080DE222|nr:MULTISPECIES: hypothetical protein [unclassified Aliivibrio]OCH15305.1 hypothetical protein A6E05_18725 [Aliivibrio sp. 1S165]OCH23625.1 hypothetical protein A6E03_08230 [Aliivibrio sp. 1S128]OCH34310.1 hypothetical protein A6E06_00305 [Aliivibrio sp. 1S175]